MAKIKKGTIFQTNYMLTYNCTEINTSFAKKKYGDVLATERSLKTTEIKNVSNSGKRAVFFIGSDQRHHSICSTG